MPSPSVRWKTRFSSGDFGNCGLACSSTFSTSSGAVTQAIPPRPLSCTTIGSS